MKKILFVLLFLCFLYSGLFSKQGNVNLKNENNRDQNYKVDLNLKQDQALYTRLAALTPGDGKISISNPKNQTSIQAGKTFKTELNLTTKKEVKNFEIWVEYDRTMVIPDKKSIKPGFPTNNSLKEKNSFYVEFGESIIKLKGAAHKGLSSGVLFSIPWISLPDAAGYENIGVIIKKIDDENSNLLSIAADKPYGFEIEPQERSISIDCSKLEKIIKANKSFNTSVRLDIGKIKVYNFEVWINYDPYRLSPKKRGIRASYSTKNLYNEKSGSFIFEESAGLIKIKGTSKTGISTGRFLSLTWNTHTDITGNTIFEIKVMTMLDKYSNPIKPEIKNPCD